MVLSLRKWKVVCSVITFGANSANLLENSPLRSFIQKYLPEELIRAFQAAYWSIRLIRIIQEV